MRRAGTLDAQRMTLAAESLAPSWAPVASCSLWQLYLTTQRVERRRGGVVGEGEMEGKLGVEVYKEGGRIMGKREESGNLMASAGWPWARSMRGGNCGGEARAARGRQAAAAAAAMKRRRGNAGDAGSNSGRTEGGRASAGAAAAANAGSDGARAQQGVDSGSGMVSRLRRRCDGGDRCQRDSDGAAGERASSALLAAQARLRAAMDSAWRDRMAARQQRQLVAARR